MSNTQDVKSVLTNELFGSTKLTHSTGMAWALLALGVGGFSLGVGEFVIMGLLPEIARDMDIAIPVAGHFISAYALGVVVGAPLLAMLTARWSRRSLLIALMAFYAIANFATAMAPSYVAIGLARFASGLPHATYFGVAALVAVAIAPPNQRARAVGFVMLGLTTALLAGVPVAVWIGQQFGWRVAFALVGFLAVLAMILLRCSVPNLAIDAEAHPMREFGALARPQVWLTLAIAGVGFGGMFCVFSYIKPLLTEVTGIGVAKVPMVLSLFGFGGIAGNLIGARLADRALMRTIGGVLSYSCLLLASFAVLVQYPPTALLGVFLLGGTVALGPAVQVRLMDVAGDAQTLTATMNHSAFNFANAFGAWLGGWAIAKGWGWTSPAWFGAMLAFGGLLVFGVSYVLQRSAAAK